MIVIWWFIGVIVVLLICAIAIVRKINKIPDEDFKDWDVTLGDGLEEPWQHTLYNKKEKEK